MNSRKQTILAAAIGAGLILLSNVFVRAETSADDHGALFKQLDANGDGFVVVKEIDKEKQRLFDRMLRTGDSNDDGRLTPAEFAVSLTPPKQPKERVGMAGYAGDGRVLEKLLNQLDRDRDGKLSKDEAPTRLRQSFAQIDADGDGGLNRLEIARAFADKARQGGQPGVGNVTDPAESEEAMAGEMMMAGDEMSAPATTPKPAGAAAKLSKAAAAPLMQRMLAEADRDADGKLSRDEAPPRLKERFEKLDANGDGFLGRDELIAAARKLNGK